MLRLMCVCCFIVCQCSREDEDDFLSGETPKTEGIVGMTPSSYESSLRSPSSLGSPPIAFQRH